DRPARHRVAEVLLHGRLALGTRRLALGLELGAGLGGGLPASGSCRRIPACGVHGGAIFVGGDPAGTSSAASCAHRPSSAATQPASTRPARRSHGSSPSSTAAQVAWVTSSSSPLSRYRSSASRTHSSSGSAVLPSTTRALRRR